MARGAKIEQNKQLPYVITIVFLSCLSTIFMTKYLESVSDNQLVATLPPDHQLHRPHRNSIVVEHIGSRNIFENYDTGFSDALRDQPANEVLNKAIGESGGFVDLPNFEKTTEPKSEDDE